MSIIQEALNKSGHKVSSKPAGRDEPPPAVAGNTARPPAPPRMKKFSYKRIAPLIRITFCLFLLIYIFALIRAPGSSNRPGADYPIDKAGAVNRPGPLIKDARRGNMREPGILGNIFGPRAPGFILNGIMQLIDGPRAIINNAVVGIGDVVGGATVSRINKDSVVLKTEDSEVTLTLR